tara:strand:- start:1262 stop:1555 length:294 start_codon:yes stop_codon:yes gene_type:complete
MHMASIAEIIVLLEHIERTLSAGGDLKDALEVVGGREKSRKGRAPGQKTARRKASAYSKRYGKAFKKLAPKYKKKGGGWKKNGFKRCSAAARKEAKK